MTGIVEKVAIEGRLSTDLPHPPHPLQCQACGAALDTTALMGPKARRVWRECDDADRPTDVVVVLCEGCSERIVSAHPRLYVAVERWAPTPGAMHLCVDCGWRGGTGCGNPAQRSKGGPGMLIVASKPATAFICSRGTRSNSGVVRMYAGPPTQCAGHQPGGTMPAATPDVSALPLWGATNRPPMTRVGVHDTSRAAATQAARDKSSKKQRIYETVEASRERGMTRTELHDATRIQKDTVNGRCRDLVVEGRLVERGKRGDEKVLYALRYAPHA